MSLEIKLDAPPISLNQTERSTRGGIRYKSPKFQKWKSEVNPQLMRFRKEISEFARSFDPYKHLIVAEYTFSIPNMYCKSGERKGLMNKTSGDLDNFPKSINDEVFRKLEMYNPEINDVYIVSMNIRKVCSVQAYMILKYDLVC